jgi:hypothetical protein
VVESCRAHHSFLSNSRGVIWTNGASTAGGLYPAVPNYGAVADVFAVVANDEVTAITADGSTARTQQGVSIR